MGTMPINKLLVRMSLPMMVSMLVQALYNVVDSIFVAKLSEDALTAVSLGFPVQMLMISVAIGTGVGVNSLLARRLGEKKINEAGMAASNGLMLAVVSSLVFALFGFLGIDWYFQTFTDNAELARMGSDYISICTIWSFGVFVAITSNQIIQATGDTVYSMLAQLAGALTNIILDPIMIFGLFGFPRLEVAGAAIATVAGQILSMILSIYFNKTKIKHISISFKGFRPNKRIIFEIYRVGLPSIVMQAIGSIMVFGMNKILILFSQTAVAVFGIYFKLQSFIFMPVFGLVNGMVPIVGYNYGAKNRERILSVIKLAMLFAVGIMTAGVLIFKLLPSFLLTTLFDASPEMLSVGVPALQIICLHFIPAAVAIVLANTFQALGNGIYSLIMSFCRQIGCILPVAYLMARFFGLNAVWFAFPIAEVISIVLALVLFRHTYRRQIRDL